MSNLVINSDAWPDERIERLHEIYPVEGPSETARMLTSEFPDLPRVTVGMAKRVAGLMDIRPSVAGMNWQDTVRDHDELFTDAVMALYGHAGATLYRDHEAAR